MLARDFNARVASRILSSPLSLCVFEVVRCVVAEVRGATTVENTIGLALLAKEQDAALIFK